MMHRVQKCPISRSTPMRVSKSSNPMSLSSKGVGKRNITSRSNIGASRKSSTPLEARTSSTKIGSSFKMTRAYFSTASTARFTGSSLFQVQETVKVQMRGKDKERTSSGLKELPFSKSGVAAVSNGFNAAWLLLSLLSALNEDDDGT